MYKKVIILFLVFSILLSVSLVNASAENTDFSLEDTNEALVLSDDVNINTDDCDFEDINEFNDSDLGLFSKYSVIVVDNESLLKSDENKIVELIDNGATLLIEDNNISLGQVSDILGLNEPDDRFVRGAQVTGGFIFNQNNEYCYGITGVVDCAEEQSDILDEDFYRPIPIYQSVDKYEYNNENNEFNINIEEFEDSIEGFRYDYNNQSSKEIKEDIVYMQLPNKAFNRVYNNYFSLKQSDYMFGSATISQYIYEICTYKEGSIKKSITDIVSNFTISPNSDSNMYVNNYRTRMHANVSNMNVIGQSYLNSNSSSTYSLSGGFSISGNVLSGSVSASTSNTYSTNNQTITNVFDKQKYKDWKVVPTKKWVKASWEIEPCIRIINNNASTYKSQAYSSFRDEGWIGFQGMFGCNIYAVEVGGAWNS